jgi:hypothetical protein
MLTLLKNHWQVLLAIGISSLLATFTGVAFAAHAWGNYHWARTSNPFTLKLGDNVSSTWDTHLSTTSSDWSQSSVLDTTIIAGQGRKNCRPTSGRVEVCNAKYGNNGWLGLAQIWVNSSSHITQGSVKLNDTYFNTKTYNTTGWRSLVMCQEVGHTLGLGHQDEDFNNDPILPHTCMDYFVPAANEIVHPNQHDYDQLDLIYAHLDSGTTIGASVPGGGEGAGVGDLDDPPAWGKILKNDKHGRPSLYERDLGGGHKLFTFVFWAERVEEEEK